MYGSFDEEFYFEYLKSRDEEEKCTKRFLHVSVVLVCIGVLIAIYGIILLSTNENFMNFLSHDHS